MSRAHDVAFFITYMLKVSKKRDNLHRDTLHRPSPIIQSPQEIQLETSGEIRNSGDAVILKLV